MLNWKTGFVAGVLMCANWAVADSIGPEVGQVAPAVLGRTVDGKLYRLKNDTHKPKVLNFFSVHCIPCKTELPELAELEKRYPQLSFVSVQVEEVSDDTVISFVKGLPAAPKTVVLGSMLLKDLYNLRGFPHTVLLDKNNKVLLNLVGYNPENKALLLKKLPELSEH